jgi:hypothetical protein
MYTLLTSIGGLCPSQLIAKPLTAPIGENPTATKIVLGLKNNIFVWWASSRLGVVNKP